MLFIDVTSFNNQNLIYYKLGISKGKTCRKASQKFHEIEMTLTLKQKW